MRDLPLPVKIHMLGLVLAAVMLGVILLPRSHLPHGEQLLLALVLTALMVATGLWQVMVSKRDMTLEFSAVFAAILLFDPGVAMLIASIGSLTSCVLVRKSFFSTTFNAVSVALAVGCAGLVLSVGGGADAIRLDEPTHLALALAAALVASLVTTINVHVSYALETARPLFSMLREEQWKAEALVFCLEFVFGLLIAMLATSMPWAVVLFAVPLYAAHAVVKNQERSRRRAQEALVHTEDKLARAQRIAHVGSWEWAAGGDGMMWSDEIYRILGYEPRSCSAIHREYLERVHPEDRGRVRQTLDGALVTSKPFDIEYRVVRPDGSERHVYVRGEVERDGTDSPVRLLGTMHDITKRKALEQQLSYQAYHDALTDLPNRALFTDRLEAAFSRISRHGGEVAVLFLDLDGFKRVNDELGHEAGDALLREVSSRLKKCLRPHDTVARLGGDEFVLLLDGGVDEEQAARVAERIIEVVGVPHIISGRRARVGGSVGIALSRAESSPDGLLREADVTMYEAKRGGKDQYRFYGASDDPPATRIASP